MARILDFSESAHRRLANLLPWYLNGTLAEREREELEAHLKGCETCRAELEDMRGVVGLLRRDARDVLAEAAFRRIEGRLDPGHPADRLRAWISDRFPSRVSRLALAVQFAAIAALAAMLWQKTEAPQPYRVLGAAATASPQRLFVRFEASAAEAHIRAALLRADARIVDGPTEAGHYVVEPVLPGAAIKERLSADPAVAQVLAVEVR